MKIRGWGDLTECEPARRRGAPCADPFAIVLPSLSMEGSSPASAALDSEGAEHNDIDTT